MPRAAIHQGIGEGWEAKIRLKSMAKKKTSVLLPGGIQGLVHDLQNGKNNFAPKVIETTVSDDDDAPEALNEEENPTKSDRDDKNVNSSDTQRVSQHLQASGAEAGKPQEYVVEGGEWSDNQSDRVGEPDVLASTEKAPVSGVEPTELLPNTPKMTRLKMRPRAAVGRKKTPCASIISSRIIRPTRGSCSSTWPRNIRTAAANWPPFILTKV